MNTQLTLAETLAVASVATFGLALLSAVAGFGGGAVLLPVFTALFGLRAAVPILTLTQLSSNGSRAWLNRRGPLTSPFFLAYGLTRAAYVGTEAAAALTMHVTKVAAYGAGDLLTGGILVYGAVLTPVTLAGAWIGKRIVGRMSDRTFVRLVEAGLVVAGLLFLAGF